MGRWQQRCGLLLSVLQVLVGCRSRRAVAGGRVAVCGDAVALAARQARRTAASSPHVQPHVQEAHSDHRQRRLPTRRTNQQRTQLGSAGSRCVAQIARDGGD